MPYRILIHEERENEKVECCETMCINNKDAECIGNYNVDEICPSNSKLCPEYELHLNPNGSKEFRTVKDMYEFLDSFEDEEINFVTIDEGCLRILYLEEKCPSGDHPKHKAFIQVSEKNQDLFNYRPNVYGSFIAIPKIQMELDL